MPEKQIYRQTDSKDSLTKEGNGPNIPNTGQTAAKCGEQRSKEQLIHTFALDSLESGVVHGAD